MWKGIGVYYFEEEHEALLLDGIRPVIRSIQAEGKLNRAYVLRDFDRGPHVAIYAELDRESYYPSVCKEIQDKLCPYLSKYPSAQELSAHGYFKLCDKWLEPARKEKVSRDLMCNHQVVLQHQSSSQLTESSRVLQELLHSFHAFNYEMVVGELEATRSNRKQRYLRILRLMAANRAYDLKMNLSNGLEAPRVRIERYLMSTHESEQVRRQYRDADEQFRRDIDDTIEEVLRYTHDDGGYSGSDCILRRWSASRRELYKAVSTLTDEGLIPDHNASIATRRSSGHSLAHHMLLETSYSLLPLFHIDRYQRYLLEYLLLQGLDRHESKQSSIAKAL